MKSGRSTRRHQRDVIILLVLLAGALLATLQWVGFPAPVRRVALQRLNAGRLYILDVQAIRFRFPFGVFLDQPRLFRRGDIGPPVMEARQVAIRINPAQWWHRRSGIRRLRIDDGIVRRSPPTEEHRVSPAAWRMPDGEQGRLEFRSLNLTGLHLAHGSVRYRVDGNWIWFEDSRSVIAPDETAGMLEGHGGIHLAERRYIGQAHGRLDPQQLRPLTQAWGLDADPLLSALEPGATLPEARLRFSGRLGTPDYTFKGIGRVEGADFQFRGIPLAACVAEGEVEYDGNQSLLQIRQTTAVLADGLISGQLQANLSEGHMTLDFSGVTSILKPLVLSGLTPPGFLHETRFDGPTRWRVHGRVDYRHRETPTALDMEFAGQAIGFQGFLFDHLDLRAHYDGHLLTFTEVKADSLGGAVSGNVVVEPNIGTAPHYRFEMTLDQLDFGGLLEATTEIRNPESYEGHLSATITGQGLAIDDWLSVLIAEGRLRIRQGRLFRLPLFGGLSQILSRIIPGLDVVLMQTSARCSFEIADNQLHIHEGRIEGEVFNIEGQGHYVFDHDLEFQVQLKLLRDQTLLGTAVRAITFPISKLFEFRLRGTLDDPRWYPVNFSSDLLDRLRGIID